jgi:hypothetical protein
MKLEEWYHFRNTQQLQGLGISGTHVTDSGNNLQSSILAGVNNLFQNCMIISALVRPQLK